MDEQDYRNLFLQKSNCYADMFKVKVEGEICCEQFDAVPAITVDVFIDILKGLKILKDHSQCPHNFPYYEEKGERHYLPCTKCKIARPVSHNQTP